MKSDNLDILGALYESNCEVYRTTHELKQAFNRAIVSSGQSHSVREGGSVERNIDNIKIFADQLGIKLTFVVQQEDLQ